MFRDVSGGELMKELVEAAQNAAAEGSEHAQKTAQQNLNAYMDHIEELLPALTEAVGAGKLDPSTLGALANSIGGDEGNVDPSALMSAATKAGLLI